MTTDQLNRYFEELWGSDPTSSYEELFEKIANDTDTEAEADIVIVRWFDRAHKEWDEYHARG